VEIGFKNVCSYRFNSNLVKQTFSAEDQPILQQTADLQM